MTLPFSREKHYAFQSDSISLRPVAELFLLPDGVVFADIGWCQPKGCSFSPFVRVQQQDLNKLVEVAPSSEAGRALQAWQQSKEELGEMASSATCLTAVQKLYPAARHCDHERITG
ncbi:hypothetical protein [Neptuniibacter halophilus]|uniref:hypothetical protein n=1 Tax=Neptuniibacter halophilus TaxID=651666 RepID=UPI0025738CF4|nr:hypothetical protein [Neptuniibacter halophilus]